MKASPKVMSRLFANIPSGLPWMELGEVNLFTFWQTIKCYWDQCAMTPSTFHWFGTWLGCTECCISTSLFDRILNWNGSCPSFLFDTLFSWMKKVVERWVLMFKCFTSIFSYFRYLIIINFELLNLSCHFTLLKINFPNNFFQLYNMTFLEHYFIF